MSDLIQTKVENSVGLLHLNREQALNSLNLEMIKDITSTLLDWKDNSEVKAICITGEGQKAFCAGGDVVGLYHYLNDSGTEVDDRVFEFFEAEYFMDYLVHKIEKPILVLAQGIVFGGGLGFIQGASHKVFFKNSLASMPEILIGLFPDVGASYFLNQGDQGFGLFCGMTAARVPAKDALDLKLCHLIADEEKKEEIKKRYLGISWSDSNQQNLSLVDSLLKDYAQSIESESYGEKFASFFDSLNKAANFEEANKLIEEQRSSECPWIQIALKNYQIGSPTSKKVTYEQLRRGRNLNLQEAFEQEVKMAGQCMLHHDFKEGVRALLIDKDRNPKWKPDQLSDVSSELVAEHFMLDRKLTLLDKIQAL